MKRIEKFLLLICSVIPIILSGCGNEQKVSAVQPTVTATATPSPAEISPTPTPTAVPTPTLTPTPGISQTPSMTDENNMGSGMASSGTGYSGNEDGSVYYEDTSGDSEEASGYYEEDSGSYDSGTDYSSSADVNGSEQTVPDEGEAADGLNGGDDAAYSQPEIGFGDFNPGKTYYNSDEYYEDAKKFGYEIRYEIE